MGAVSLLLTIDIGNTETKIGLFAQRVLVHTWRLQTNRQRTADEYVMTMAQFLLRAQIELTRIRAVVVASVVPTVNQVVQEACRLLFEQEPHFFRPTEQTLMPIATAHPAEVGADLVAAAIAARYRRGAPVIVITFGTATAYAAVGASGAYLGGAIAPGIQIALDALIQRTAKLPQISLESPPSAIGRTTVEALQSGLLFGVVGQTEGIVARFRAELGAQAPVVASGGFAATVAQHTAIIDEALPYLVLEGLAHYAEANGIS